MELKVQHNEFNPKMRFQLLVIAILAALVHGLPLVGAHVKKPEGAQGREISKLAGDWVGESVCVNKEKFPACNNEHVVYHVVVASGKTDTVTIAADKIVNGKPEPMGTFDFVYDARRQSLTSELKNDRVHIIFELAVKGEFLEGTLSTLPERTLVRRIKVKKDH